MVVADQVTISHLFNSMLFCPDTTLKHCFYMILFFITGRVKRKKNRKAAAGDGGDDEEED